MIGNFERLKYSKLKMKYGLFVPGSQCLKGRWHFSWCIDFFAQLQCHNLLVLNRYRAAVFSTTHVSCLHYGENKNLMIYDICPKRTIKITCAPTGYKNLTVISLFSILLYMMEIYLFGLHIEPIRIICSDYPSVLNNLS